MADPALVLLGFPVEFVGTDCGEGGHGGVDDDQVDVVAEVGPDAGEEAEIGDCDWGVEVIQGLGGLRMGIS